MTNPNRLCAPRWGSTCFRSASSRRKNRSSSALDGTSSKRPYAVTCSSLRNSTGTEINLRATPNPDETPAYRQPLFRCMSDPKPDTEARRHLPSVPARASATGAVRTSAGGPCGTPHGRAVFTPIRRYLRESRVSEPDPEQHDPRLSPRERRRRTSTPDTLGRISLPAERH